MGAYTTIDDSSAHFKAIKYAGDNVKPRDITVGFKPDWVWVKELGSRHHRLFTSNTGTAPMYVNKALAQDHYNDGPEVITNYSSTQYRIIENPSSVTDGRGVNHASFSYVAYCLKGSGSAAVSNTDGNITTSCQANPTAGFSFITYTGQGTQTGKTVGHGLGAVPKFIISKDINATSNVTTWRIYHAANGNTKYMDFSNSAMSTYNDWDNTDPTSSVYSVGGAGGYTPTNTNLANYVAHVFAEVQGFSQFGSYTGNGNGNGPFIPCSFKPAWIMVKRTDSTGHWFMLDTARNTYNLTDLYLIPSNYATETNASSAFQVDIWSSGFKLRTSYSETNTSGANYIYAAFAKNPFVTSSGVPGTAH
jgi:hypothetical protein